MNLKTTLSVLVTKARRSPRQALAMLTCLRGIVAGWLSDDRLRTKQFERGYVVMLPGVEGRKWQLAGVVRGLRDAGVDQAIEVSPWARYTFSSLDNLRNLARNRKLARSMADKITTYRRDYPNRPMTLIGYSGGGGLALLVAEMLPDDIKLDRFVLVAAAISPQFDLSQALAHCRNGLVSFYSQGDWLMIGLCTRLFGTIDRVKTDSAGRTGFLDEAGTLREMEGLKQIPYDPNWIRLGHDGGHFGGMSRPWAREVLAPLIENPCKSKEE